ncbi:MAG: hypothetical protein ACXWE6_12375, partial [Nitrososphaeraceae archaeon]
KKDAKKAIKLLSQLYAPEKEKELNKVFFGEENKTINSSNFTLIYTYDRGPAIDERMIVVSEKNIKTSSKTIESPISNPTQLVQPEEKKVAEDKHSYTTNLKISNSYLLGLFFVFSIIIFIPKKTSIKVTLFSISIVLIIFFYLYINERQSKILNSNKNEEEFKIIEELNQYAAEVEAYMNNDIFGHEIIKTNPTTYVIRFQTNHPNLMADENGDKDSKAYARNQALAASWDKAFCTSKLKSIIAKYGLLFVTGDLRNSKGNDSQSIDICS